MTQSPVTLSDRMRALTGGFMQRIGLAVHRLGIHPDTITIAGLIVVAIGAYCIAVGQIQLGGVLLVISLPLDALDGAVARAMGRKDRFGAVLDSTLDRYADGLDLRRARLLFRRSRRARKLAAGAGIPDGQFCGKLCPRACR